MRVATGLMLGLVLLAAGAARAEMTPADEASMRTFAACLDENGGDEDACVGKLSLYAWYPVDDKVCDTIGVRVEKVIELGGQPKWRDLFRNERCARLGLPHGAGAARAGTRWDQQEPYAQCSELEIDWRDCKEELGRHAWHPYDENDCLRTLRGLRKQEQIMDPNRPYIWFMLFHTERCRRLGFAYFEPGAAQ